MQICYIDEAGDIGESDPAGLNTTVFPNFRFSVTANVTR